MDACSDALGLPLTAAYSTAHVQPPDSCSASDRPGAGTALRRRGYGALSRERETHERFGRNDPFVTLLTDLGVQPAARHIYHLMHHAQPLVGNHPISDSLASVHGQFLGSGGSAPDLATSNVNQNFSVRHFSLHILWALQLDMPWDSGRAAAEDPRPVRADALGRGGTRQGVW